MPQSEEFREHGGLAPFRPSEADLAADQAALPITRATEAINAKIAELGGRFGKRVSDLLDTGGFRYVQALEHADVWWSSRTGAHEVHGAIRDKWLALGGRNSLLGLPVTDETAAAGGVGRFNDFADGSIYWHPAVGAHEVHGAIRAKWLELGGSAAVGYPVTDEIASDAGRYNDFAIQAPDLVPDTGPTSAIYWAPHTGAHLVRGELLQTWRSSGAQQSFLRYPVSDHGLDGNVRFERGSMYSHRNSKPTITPDQRNVDCGQLHFSGGTAATGHARLLICSDGSWNYSGHVRATGAASYSFHIASGLVVADDGGWGRAFLAKGTVEGTLTWGGSRVHKWDHWGTDSWIADNWDRVQACPVKTILTVEFGAEELLGHIGTVVGIPLLAIGAAIAAGWFIDNHDACGGVDADGNKRVEWVPKGHQCPPGMHKSPRSSDAAGDMPGDG